MSPHLSVAARPSVAHRAPSHEPTGNSAPGAGRRADKPVGGAPAAPGIARSHPPVAGRFRTPSASAGIHCNGTGDSRRSDSVRSIPAASADPRPRTCLPPSGAAAPVGRASAADAASSGASTPSFHNGSATYDLAPRDEAAESSASSGHCTAGDESTAWHVTPPDHSFSSGHGVTAHAAATPRPRTWHHSARRVAGSHAERYDHTRIGEFPRHSCHGIAQHKPDHCSNPR